MAATQSVGPGQGDDFAVVEAHAAEDGAEMSLIFGAVWEATVGCTHGDVAVCAAWAPWDGWPLHFLDCADAGEGPEVGVGDPWVFFWEYV